MFILNSQLVSRLKRLMTLSPRRAGSLIMLNLGYTVYALIDHVNDRWYGVSTGTSLRGLEPLDHLALKGDAAHAIAYTPTPYGTLRKLFRALSARLSDYAFVDFGSGRGRVLIVAAKFGFREVVGIEFARELHEAACSNLVAARVRNARSVHGDAQKFQIPDLPCVLFFFNPFTGEVLRNVAANIVASLRRNPRHIVVAMLNESSVAPFLEGGFFTLRATIAETRLARFSHRGRYMVKLLESQKPRPALLDR